MLADKCNGHKSDVLPALAHVDRWVDRLAGHGSELHAVAGDCGWESALDRTVALARTTYAHLPDGTPLWFRGKDFRLDSPGSVTERLAALSNAD